MFRQLFRFDEWTSAGVRLQADWQHDLRAEVRSIGRHAVKAQMRSAAIVQQGMRTPTGPSYGKFSIRTIRGLGV